MSRIRARIFVALALLVTAIAPGHAQTGSPPKIGITSIAFSAEIQAVVDGMRDRLAARDFRPGQTVDFLICDSAADAARATEVVRDFTAQNVRVIVAITHPSIQAALKNRTRIPIIGAGLSMAQALQISKDHRRRAVTGIAESDTRDDQLSLIRLLAPDIRAVAIPVDPERGSMSIQLQDMIAAARSYDLTAIPIPVSIRRNAVGDELGSLDPQTTVMLLDRQLLPGAPVEALATATRRQKLRLFASTEDSVVRGALAAMVIEPYGIGQQLGDLVANILENPSAARVPFERARASHLVLNEEARSVLNVDAIEAELAEQRRSVIDWAEDAGPRPRVKPPIPEAPAPLGVVRGITVPTPRSKPPRP
jgi:ABC-type uncharacterized transport system substrate-binding protein